MSLVYTDLHQFSNYTPPINLTFHQYLLLTEDPILVHTGSIGQAEALVPYLKESLNGNQLKYIFISHFESDECGGLSVILNHFPEATPICSEVTARQLSGFGITNNFLIKRPGEKLVASGYELEFLSYPSEIHLWEGLLLIENNRKIFFSSDLMFGFGETNGSIVKGIWQDEVANIKEYQVPDPNQRAKLQQVLSQVNPKFIATGHGSCIKFDN